MKKIFTICFLATGGVDIEAENEDEALNEFADIDPQIILDTFVMNGWEVTEVIEED